MNAALPYRLKPSHLLDAGQMLQVLFVDFAFAIVTTVRFLAYQDLRTSASQRLVRAIAIGSLDDAMQVLSPLLCQRKARFRLSWIGEKRRKLFAVCTVAS